MNIVIRENCTIDFVNRKSINISEQNKSIFIYNYFALFHVQRNVFRKSEILHKMIAIKYTLFTKKLTNC